MSYFNQIQSNFNPANMSAFGTLETAELTPILQGDFVYGLNTQIWNTSTVSGAGATVDTSNGRLRIQSGTNSAGYAYITSRKIVRYRAGQGTVVRFTPVFSTGIASNVQAWGIGTIAANALYDGWFFGYNGTSFGICHAISGSLTWTAQTSWNGDAMNGSGGSGITWDPTKGSPVMIKYPYLGYGDIEFYIQNPTTAAWILVHVIRYANTTSTLELSNPSLQFLGFTINSGNIINQTMYCGSIGTFVSGARSFASNPKWATDNNKAAITTETCIFNLQNCTSYNGSTNRGLLRLNSLSAGTPTNNTLVVVRLKLGATIGGSPSYTAVSGSGGPATITAGNSIASVDTAGTTVSGGTQLFSITSGASSLIDLTPLDIFIVPGEILSVTATASASATVGVSLNWSEDT